MKSVTVGWFEIPVSNMERAIAFYEKVFDTKLSRNQIGEFDMAWFPWDENGGGAGGSLIYHQEICVTSADGVLVYFSSDDVNTELKRIEDAGGQILVPKTEISPEIGFMAVFLDSEGNRIALHSRQ